MNGPLQERTLLLRVDQAIDEDQRQELARRVSRETTKVFDLLTNAMKIHLNLEQSFEVNTPTLFVRIETVKSDSLKSKQIQTIGEARLRFPNQSFQIENDHSKQYYSLRVSLPQQTRGNHTFLFFSQLWNRWPRLDIRQHRKRIVLERFR